jgi:hypothetical protein
MITTIAILLLLLAVTLSLGGGLYEILVIYPNWKHDADPLTLRAKLESSGQINAAKRFWPLVSPAQVLLSIINITLAWNYSGEAHGYWLGAAIAIFINRVITFSYFIPVMIRKIMQPEDIEASHLQSIVKQWTALSPLRLFPELLAWCLLIVALMHI